MRRRDFTGTATPVEADLTLRLPDVPLLSANLADAATKVAGGVYAYAKKVKNNDLVAQTNVTVTSFMDGRDTLAATNAVNVHPAVTQTWQTLRPTA